MALGEPEQDDGHQPFLAASTNKAHYTSKTPHAEQDDSHEVVLRAPCGHMLHAPRLFHHVPLQWGRSKNATNLRALHRGCH